MESIPVRIKSDSGAGHRVTTVEVAGVNIAGMSRALKLEASVDSVVTLSVDMFAMGGFDVELPAAVTVNIQPLEEGFIEETTMGDSVKRYRFVRKAEE